MAGLNLKKKKKKGQLGACVSCCLPRVHSHYTFPLLFTPSPSKMKRPIHFWKFKIKKVVELLFPLNLFLSTGSSTDLKGGPAWLTSQPWDLAGRSLQPPMPPATLCLKREFKRRRNELLGRGAAVE